MKKSFQLLLATGLLFSVVSWIGLSADKLPSPFVILPQPQSVELLKGAGLESGKLHQILLKGEFKLPVMDNILSQMTIGKSAGTGTLTLILDKTITSLSSDEGYIK
jgi:hypothetical protein